ncbi:hypothetical protein V6Z11_D12G084400 [Gossypium hirsutum]
MWHLTLVPCLLLVETSRASNPQREEVKKKGNPQVRGQIQKWLSCQVYNRKRNACLRTPPTCFLKREKWTSPQTIGIEKKKYAIRSLGLIHLHL